MKISNLIELFHFRELLWTWSLREIRIRYKQSILGGFWAILQPISSMLIFWIIFGYFVKVPSDGVPYPVFFYSALLPWTFFSTSISFAVPSLINNLNLVTKIYFPREILPIGSIIAAFVDFLIASLIYSFLILIYRIPLQITLLWLPLLLGMQILLTFGVAFFGAAVIVFYRDVRFMVTLGLQLWMYLTPIVYPLSVVPPQWRFLYMLNPMTSIIDGYRRIILHGQAPDLLYLGLDFVIILILFIAGYAYFKKSEPFFSDII